MTTATSTVAARLRENGGPCRARTYDPLIKSSRNRVHTVISRSTAYRKTKSYVHPVYSVLKRAILVAVRVAVKVTGTVPNLETTGRQVKAVRQKGQTLNIDFNDGSSAEIGMAEATSSVMLRDAKGTMEYAD